MDAVSVLLSAYLNTVSNSVYSHMTDMTGTELQALVINYQDMNIPFQYQLWRVRDVSVCGTYKDRIDRYSVCTIKAKEMFSHICTELSAKESKDWRYIKTKNMYCNAAVTFKPTIASVAAEEVVTEEEERRKACNLATAAALGSADRKLIAERDKACGRK